MLALHLPQSRSLGNYVTNTTHAIDLKAQITNMASLSTSLLILFCVSRLSDVLDTIVKSLVFSKNFFKQQPTSTTKLILTQT